MRLGQVQQFRRSIVLCTKEEVYLVDGERGRSSPTVVFLVLASEETTIAEGTFRSRPRCARGRQWSPFLRPWPFAIPATFYEKWLATGTDPADDDAAGPDGVGAFARPRVSTTTIPASGW